MLIGWTTQLAVQCIHLPGSQRVSTSVQALPDWLAGLAESIQRYFRGDKVDFNKVCSYFSTSDTRPYLDGSHLTPFQRNVYDAVSKLPYGSVMSYGEVAALIDKPGAARAVGRAMGANPFPLVVPCHRVVGAHTLGGFSGGCGVDLKQHMLSLEGVQMS